MLHIGKRSYKEGVLDGEESKNILSLNQLTNRKIKYKS